MSHIAMSRITMNKFQLLVATSLIMSATMASSAWADCFGSGCPPHSADGGSSGTDSGQPLGVYMGQTRESYGLDSSNGSNSNSHNGYATASQGRGQRHVRGSLRTDAGFAARGHRSEEKGAAACPNTQGRDCRSSRCGTTNAAYDTAVRISVGAHARPVADTLS